MLGGKARSFSKNKFKRLSVIQNRLIADRIKQQEKELLNSGQTPPIGWPYGAP